MKFEELWRIVETGDPDKMEFCRGGWKHSVRGGYFCMAVSLVYAVSLVGIFIYFRNELLTSLRNKNYEDAINFYAFGAVLSFVVFECFCMGAWFVFGRTDVVLDRRSKSITKTYRLRSYCVFRQDYAIGPSSTFLLRQETRSFAPIHYLRLNDNADKQCRVLIVPRKFVKHGWTMAKQMAEFFKIPLVAADAS